MRHDAGARADAHRTVDHDVRADLGGWIDLGARVDDGRRVDRHLRAAPLLSRPVGDVGLRRHGLAGDAVALVRPGREVEHAGSARSRTAGAGFRSSAVSRRQVGQRTRRTGRSLARFVRALAHRRTLDRPVTGQTVCRRMATGRRSLRHPPASRSRRAAPQELSPPLLARHGALVTSAPALREARPAGERAPALELLEAPRRASDVGAVVLLDRCRARARSRRVAGRRRARACSRRWHGYRSSRAGRSRSAALRELGVAGARPSPTPHTWREVLAVARRRRASAPPAPRRRAGVRRCRRRSVVPMAHRGAAASACCACPCTAGRCPRTPACSTRRGATLAAGGLDVAVFTSAVQVEHLFRVAPDAGALRGALRRIVVASIGPVCCEALEAHGRAPELEATPPKMGPLVALVAARAPGAPACATVIAIPPRPSRSSRGVADDRAVPGRLPPRADAYTPIWLMRQAGRYMPEYRAVRERLGFLELCKTPDAAAEVTVTAVEQLGVDAAIIFADILLVLEPLGVGLEFAQGRRPGDPPAGAHARRRRRARRGRPGGARLRLRGGPPGARGAAGRTCR